MNLRTTLQDLDFGTARTAPARRSSLVRPASLSATKNVAEPCPLGLPDVPQPSSFAWAFEFSYLEEMRVASDRSISTTNYSKG